MHVSLVLEPTDIVASIQADPLVAFSDYGLAILGALLIWFVVGLFLAGISYRPVVRLLVARKLSRELPS